MEKELISIIIPVYKVEDFLNRCIESVITQTYTNIEIVLVDDGSPDNCPEICDSYAKKDKRISVIHKPNGGLSSARNTGLEACNGDLIYFLDSDDYISPDCIASLYSALVYTDSDVAIGLIKNVYSTDYLLEDVLEKKGQIITSGKDVLTKILKNEASAEYIIACNKLIKKTVIGNIQFPLKKFHEDEYFNWKLFLNTKQVCLVNSITYYYYQRPTSITGVGFGNHNFDYLGALNERLEYFANDSVLFPCVVKSYRMLLINYFYIPMSKLEDCSSLNMSKDDILSLFYDSFNTYPFLLDKKLYSIKERIKLSIFKLSPSIWVSFSKLKNH